jgi:hypothetical protein
VRANCDWWNNNSRTETRTERPSSSPQTPTPATTTTTWRITATPYLLFDIDRLNKAEQAQDKEKNGNELHGGCWWWWKRGGLLLLLLLVAGELVAEFANCEPQTNVKHPTLVFSSPHPFAPTTMLIWLVWRFWPK